MELQLTNNEKYMLLDINPEELCKKIKNEVFTKELYTIKDEELDLIQGIIGDSIELEVDTEASENNNVRVSFYTLNDKIVVIKRKKIDIKLLIDLLIHSVEFSVGNTGTRIVVILNILQKLFLNILDDDVAILYSYLCKEYFVNGNKFSNIEIFGNINKHLKEYLGLSWSNNKINKILLQLERLQVIEFSNGILHVKDKIYFE